MQIRIVDNGIGIPNNKLSAVLNGLSLKHGGKGLGLSNAKATMENNGGTLIITSSPGAGTEIILCFNKVHRPLWLPYGIDTACHESIILLDDDPVIHNMWQLRLQPKKLIHFQRSQEFFLWYQANSVLRDDAIYLIDYELRDDPYNGLDVLQEINVKDRAYLITSHFNENVIQNRVEKIGVWLVPKPLISEISILK